MNKKVIITSTGIIASRIDSAKTNFIDGILSIEKTGTQTFYIGKNNVYRPFTLFNISGSGSVIVEAEFINSAPGGIAGTGLDHISLSKYWRISSTGTKAPITVTGARFYYNDTLDAATVNAEMRIAKSDLLTGTYDNISNGVGVNTVANPGRYINSVGFTVNSTSYLSLASTTKNNPLPIELISFEGKLINNKVYLNWITSTEINNDYFEIQNSINGIDFKTLASLKGAGNSVLNNYYDYIDENPSKNINYYRLKQVDFDGNYSFSKVIIVDNILNNEINNLNIYPNPIKKDDNILVSINKISENEKIEISIFDINGKVCFLQTFVNLSDGGSRFLIPIKLNLEKGVYFIKINSNTIFENKKIIID